MSTTTTTDSHAQNAVAHSHVPQQTTGGHGRGPRAPAIAEARQFVHDNSFGNLNTLHIQGKFTGFPTSQVEYYVDTARKDASLLLIKVDMSGAFRNIGDGSAASLTIRTGDHPDAVTPIELASSRRIVLYGEFETTEPGHDEQEEFFSVHPDAREWAPGSSGFHSTYWVRFNITGIYYIGGFGDKHYIGQIPTDKYASAPVDHTTLPVPKGRAVAKEIGVNSGDAEKKPATQGQGSFISRWSKGWIA